MPSVVSTGVLITRLTKECMFACEQKAVCEHMYMSVIETGTERRCVMQVIEMQASVQPDAAEINHSVTDGKITTSMIVSPLCAALPHGIFRMPVFYNECSLQYSNMIFEEAFTPRNQIFVLVCRGLKEILQHSEVWLKVGHKRIKSSSKI